jgi:hypothetical protein
MTHPQCGCDRDRNAPAANPAGAVVLISSVFLFEHDGEGAPPIEGTDYVGAYLDLNGDTHYDPLEDPVSVPGSASGWSIQPLGEKATARAEQWRLLRAHIDRALAEGR